MDQNDQANRERELSRSSQARQLLGNKLFQESIDTLKKIYSEALLEKTGAKESETREKLWIAYNVVGKVEQHLKSILETGKLAEKQLDVFRKQQQDKKF
jgi:3-oxoacyl-[acyl-carrier-protein] synthase III